MPEIVTITEIIPPENASIFSDRFVDTCTTTKKGDFEGLRSSLSATNLCSNLEHDDINNDWQS